MFNGDITVNRETNMAIQSFQMKPYTLAHGEGKSIYAFGKLLAVIKADSEQTGATFNLFEVTCPPGYATDLQIHYAEDVAVYVLEGALDFFWGCEKKDAVAGSFFYQPRGTPHGFRVKGETPARILYLAFPGGMDRFISERACEIEGMAARYKVEILGPLPE